MKKLKDIFVVGSITPHFIADCIQKHTVKTEIGGHSLFLGQVRRDQKEGVYVRSIDFTTYRQMALAKAHEIREEIIIKYSLSCAHVYHALGEVPVGEVCLFVFTSSPHRKEAIKACEEFVERIKEEVPIWGKEILEDQSYKWKENKSDKDD